MAGFTGAVDTEQQLWPDIIAQGSQSLDRHFPTPPALLHLLYNLYIWVYGNHCLF